jgi:hypothetical protein
MMPVAVELAVPDRGHSGTGGAAETPLVVQGLTVSYGQ